MTSSRIALITLIFLVCAIVAVFAAGEILSRPATRSVGEPPSDFSAQVVKLSTSPAGSIVGWLAPGQVGNGVVVLLHGVQANRTQMLARARFLRRARYATLLIDLPAHGESTGERITFGARETAGVIASLEYVKRVLPAERIGIIGVSLGAAATVLAHPRPAPDAVVLESMYPTIEEAIEDRLTARLGPIGAHLAPLLLWQLPLRAGVNALDLRPIHDLPRLGAPVLIASGSDDKHTTWLETQRVFDTALAPKELWRVEGAAHVDLHAFAPEEYERRILQFLAKHLRRETVHVTPDAGNDSGRQPVSGNLRAQP